MPTHDQPSSATAIADFLHGRADELTRTWAEELRRARTGETAGPGDHARFNEEQAASCVNDVIARVRADGGYDASDPSQAQAFAAAAMESGVGLSQILQAFDVLSDLMVQTVRDHLVADGMTPSEAFDAADRIHRAVRAAASGAADARQTASSSAAPVEGGESFEDFTRTVAHELKNPLGAARGAAELLATGEGMETQEARERFAQLVIRNVNRALELLDDVRGRTPGAPPAGSADT